MATKVEKNVAIPLTRNEFLSQMRIGLFLIYVIYESIIFTLGRNLGGYAKRSFNVCNEVLNNQ
jgi:hypothetical protein